MDNLDDASGFPIRGRIISPGVAFGYAYSEEPYHPPHSRSVIEPQEAAEEIRRLNKAIHLVRNHLETHVRSFHSPAEEDLQQILAAHLMVLDDRGFFASIFERIETRFFPAQRAVQEAFLTTAERLGACNDAYMRARAEDLRDLCRNLQRALHLGDRAFVPIDQKERSLVVIAPHLYPSAVLRARRDGAVAFLSGSVALTSHGAILLRASGIPALGGLALPANGIQPGTPILVDAIEGEITIRPRPEASRKALARFKASVKSEPDVTQAPLDARLVDGGTVQLWANINHPDQARLCLEHRLSGVGLFRTEFLVLERGRLPDEEEQYRIYRGVVDRLAGRPLVIRTFDIGADKNPGGLDECTGRNPALGVRGLRRHLLRYPEELRAQLRAALRAAFEADVSILLPVVTHVDDVRTARDHLDEVARELANSGIPFNPRVRVGAMLEVPSAALGIGALLEAADFVSIGTNDLIQYLTAADRDNPSVICYHDAESSGIYELLAFVMRTARSLGRERDVFVCGELASEPEGAAALVRLGIHSLSIVPMAAARVRKALQCRSNADDLS